jgi:hypothetical protein
MDQGCREIAARRMGLLGRITSCSAITILIFISNIAFESHGSPGIEAKSDNNT